MTATRDQLGLSFPTLSCCCCRSFFLVVGLFVFVVVQIDDTRRVEKVDGYDETFQTYVYHAAITTEMLLHVDHLNRAPGKELLLTAKEKKREREREQMKKMNASEDETGSTYGQNKEAFIKASNIERTIAACSCCSKLSEGAQATTTYIAMPVTTHSMQKARRTPKAV